MSQELRLYWSPFCVLVGVDDARARFRCAAKRGPRVQRRTWCAAAASRAATKHPAVASWGRGAPVCRPLTAPAGFSSSSSSSRCGIIALERGLENCGMGTYTALTVVSVLESALRFQTTPRLRALR